MTALAEDEHKRRERAWCFYRNLVHTCYREGRHLGKVGDRGARLEVDDPDLQRAMAQIAKWRRRLGGLSFCARDDDVIIMAGYRIGPFEVESVLATHAAVAECAVVGIPDPLRGEVIEAFVVLRKPTTATNELAEELQSFVKTRYAAHAYPRTMHFVDSLPTTPSGKVQRFLLRDQRKAELAATTND
jgi:acyl-CoA synthetase (AMP-forming)/AMP-acid ligase II